MARVMRAAVRAAAPAYPPAAAAAWGRLPALYHRWALAAGGEARVVAVDAGRVVGFAGWRGREVTALFVHPAAAGRRLGARLLAAAERGAAAGPAGPLAVVAARGAVGFYLAHGWRDAGPGRSPLPGGPALPARRLVKRRPAPPSPGRHTSRSQASRSPGIRSQRAASARSRSAAAAPDRAARPRSARRAAAIGAAWAGRRRR